MFRTSGFMGLIYFPITETIRACLYAARTLGRLARSPTKRKGTHLFRRDGKDKPRNALFSFTSKRHKGRAFLENRLSTRLIGRLARYCASSRTNDFKRTILVKNHNRVLSCVLFALGFGRVASFDGPKKMRLCSRKAIRAGDISDALALIRAKALNVRPHCCEVYILLCHFVSRFFLLIYSIVVIEPLEKQCSFHRANQHTDSIGSTYLPSSDCFVFLSFTMYCDLAREGLVLLSLMISHSCEDCINRDSVMFHPHWNGKSYAKLGWHTS